MHEICQGSGTIADCHLVFKTEWLKQQTFLTVVAARSPRLGCQHDWVLSKGPHPT